ncbi:MAG: DUF4097 family beta strand repeat-containing protein [Janthinobacterium lividum]
MRPSSVVRLACVALLVPAAAAVAQSDTAWEKSYPLSGSPTLALEVGDSSLSVHACSGCRAVHILVAMLGEQLSNYTLVQEASGNRVHFSLKEKAHVGLHMNFHMNMQRYVRVEVETPPDVTLDARTGDGGLSVAGLRGAITLQTSNGSQSVQDVSGTLRLHGLDGAIHVQRASGTLEAQVTDGALSVDGAFTALRLQSTDGAVSVNLAEGSHLNAPSSIQGKDGSVSVHLPHNFPANLDLRTNDGSLHSSLPLTVDEYASHDDSGHSIHGKLDGGGAPFTIHTSDGSLSLSRS